MQKLTFITPTHGNPIALKRTMDSLAGVCDEFIVGDVIIFPSDRALIHSYKSEYNLKVIPFEFNYLFNNGFSDMLNSLISHSTNNFVLYLNVGEIIEKGKDGILSKLSDEYNSYYLNHSQELHRWFRLFDKREVKWSGLIHEDSIGNIRPYHKPIFTFADTEKDMYDAFKAKILNDSKELVYFHNYMRLADEPDKLGATDPGWVEFAKANYASMGERLNKKGKRFEAFKNGDLYAYLEDAYSNPEFKDEVFNSSTAIEFTGDPKFLNKS